MRLSPIVTIGLLWIAWVDQMLAYRVTGAAARRIVCGGGVMRRGPLVRFCSTNTNFEEVVSSYKKLKAPRKIVGVVQEYSSTQRLTPRFALTAVKSLASLERFDLLPDILPHCIATIRSTTNFEDTAELMALASTARLFAKLGVVEAAEQILNKVADRSIVEKDLHTIQIAVLPELSLAYIKAGAVHKAQTCLDRLQELGATINADSAKSILKQFLLQGRSDTILKALGTLLTLNELNDHESVQMLTNYYMRNIDFVKGAVSLRTAPEPTCPEVCFIGRSNVGKSSLINMLCNRKGLVYVSKTPGKTTEYNYFEAKGTVGALKEESRFHLVDLPGVGFAKKDKGTRKGWSDLLSEYTTQRETLKVVYHLVDSRHGLLEADEECLSLLESLPAHVQYVIVLTKADKQGSGEKGGALLQGVAHRVQTAVKQRTERDVPIFLTSSQTKRGAVPVLLHLFNAVAEPVASN